MADAGDEMKPTNITRDEALEMLKTDSIPENAYLMVQGFGISIDDDEKFTGLFAEDYDDILDSPELTVFELWVEDSDGDGDTDTQLNNILAFAIKQSAVLGATIYDAIRDSYQTISGKRNAENILRG